MKQLLIILLCFSAMSFINWQPDFETAKQTATEKHRLILLNFSGSDWCGPCMRMRKEIFETEAFTNFADSSLVLVNADFPRNKKNQPNASFKKANEALADAYNKEGSFPFTVLLDAQGKILKSWTGLPSENAAQFANEIKLISHANR